jgi:pyruvate dehydrogenase E1 component
MLERQEDVFYYVTVMNENYPQPSLPANVADDLIKGLYRFSSSRVTAPVGEVRLLGAGALLPEVLAAGALLAEDWQIDADIWSVTSFTELERDARDTRRWNRLHPAEAPRTSHVARCLPPGAPVIAASDYVRALPLLIANDLQSPYTVLGTDGFGRSDTRARLRAFFEVDRFHIVLAALTALADSGQIPRQHCATAIERYGIKPVDEAPWYC